LTKSVVVKEPEEEDEYGGDDDEFEEYYNELDKINVKEIGVIKDVL